MEQEKTNLAVTLSDAANIKYLSPDEVSFYKSGDFLGATFKTDDGDETYDRVWLHRSFPIDMPNMYISVQNKDSEEIGMIRDLSEYDEETKALIAFELDRKYYTPKITKIISLKETRGYSFWKVMSDAGELSFSLQDTYRSMSRVGPDRAFITDVCGNRYEIASLEALDKKSRRKLDIYL